MQFTAPKRTDRPQATGHRPQVGVTIIWVLLAGVVLAFSACASMSRKEKGAVMGSSAYNQDLSQRRATSASAYLTVQGVSAGRMNSSGRGEQEPAGANETEEGRQTNGRIEVAIFSGATR